jgi:hypothetical protein
MENPKHEFRNSKQSQNYKSQFPKHFLFGSLGNLNLFRFRASNFEFYAVDRRLVKQLNNQVYKSLKNWRK